MSNILVTGGSGFLGSHLVDALVAQGHTVTVIDLEPPHPVWGNAQASYVQMDIRNPGIADVFMQTHPDVIFHLAAHIEDRASIDHPVENAEHNILGTLQVCEAARVVHAQKIIFLSTGVIYGNQEQMPIAETAVPRPLTPYAISKLTGERYLHFYQNHYGIACSALRAGNIYGPRQDSSRECGAIAIFLRKLLRGEGIFMNNDGLTTRDYIFVSDVVEAALAAMASSATGVYNVSTGKGTTTTKILEDVQRLLNTDVVPAPRPEIPDLVKRVVLDPMKARQTFGWTAQIDLAQGLEQTAAWYREQL